MNIIDYIYDRNHGSENSKNRNLGFNYYRAFNNCLKAPETREQFSLFITISLGPGLKFQLLLTFIDSSDENRLSL